jgi:hypothetical protein
VPIGTVELEAYELTSGIMELLNAYQGRSADGTARVEAAALWFELGSTQRACQVGLGVW